MKKQTIKKLISTKKSDVDRLIWDGGITDKVLSIIAICILIGIAGFLIFSFIKL